MTSCTRKFIVTSRVISSIGIPKLSWNIRNSSGAKLFTIAWVMYPP